MSTSRPNRSFGKAVRQVIRHGLTRSEEALRSAVAIASQSDAASRLSPAVRFRVARWAQGHAGGDAVEALRDSWSTYPEDWKRDPKLNLGVRTLGEEWGTPAFADYIVQLVSPHLGTGVDVLELGCGGGKFSRRLAPRCRSLVCTDISAEMIDHARGEVARAGVGDNVSYKVLNGVDFTGVADASVDFIFSYDVQLHLQPHNVFSYMLDARRVLRGGGVFMQHQLNLNSPGGTQHFLDQYLIGMWKRAFDDPRRRGFLYYMSVDQMTALADEAGLQLDRIVHDSDEFRSVTGGRDLIGFMRRQRGRLESALPGTAELVKIADDPHVYAVIDGQRLRFCSARQFERAGLRWEDVRELGQEELDSIPDGGMLEAWE